MGFSKNLSYQIENLSLKFQGGVRRSVIIAYAIMILLLTPSYFIGQFVSQIWFASNSNDLRFDDSQIVTSKVLVEADYQIDRSQIVPLAGEETVLYTTINNRMNTEIGYYPFVYRIQAQDVSGAVLWEDIKESYLLPNSFKYVIAEPKTTESYRLVITTEPETQEVYYNQVADNIAKQVDLQVRNARIVDEADKDLELRASIKNNNQVNIAEVTLIYILRDARDRVVGIGNFVMENILSQEERDFYVRYPRPRYRRATKLDIRTEVNYLDPNVISL